MKPEEKRLSRIANGPTLLTITNATTLLNPHGRRTFLIEFHDAAGTFYERAYEIGTPRDPLAEFVDTWDYPEAYALCLLVMSATAPSDMLCGHLPFAVWAPAITTRTVLVDIHQGQIGAVVRS